MTGPSDEERNVVRVDRVVECGRVRWDPTDGIYRAVEPWRSWRRRLHHWWALGWGNKTKAESPHLTWSFCLSNFNRPIIRWAFEPGCRFVCIEWGNGNSDPAWSLGWEW